jgi:hypothetical protein
MYPVTKMPRFGYALMHLVQSYDKYIYRYRESTLPLNWNTDEVTSHIFKLARSNFP